ncbi:hypothetical protein FQY21_16100 [Escherichia coli]|nr:hypothetical protein [Escherichia coli]
MITRDFLMNADCKTAFGAIEESLLWSAEQRAASLAATLACRPDEGPVWIFGYGSLMWNPALEFTESCTGTLVGWHRAQVIAPLIAAASGPLGTNAQYLFSLEQELIKLGMQDDGLNDLLVSVKKLLAENYPDGVLRPGFA